MKQLDPQTPVAAEIFLDHVGWFIPDVGQASAVFERLGFVLTPFVVSRNADPAGGPPRPAGTGNRCAMLRRGYLELIAAIDGVDTALAQQHRAAVSRYTGLHVIAFTVADPASAYARLKSEGFEPGEPVLLRRPIQLHDGSETLAAFTVVRVPPHQMPEGRIQILTQETPDLVWQDRLLARGNGITGLSGVLVCVNDPAEAAERYGRFVGRTPAGRGDYLLLQLDRGRIGFGTPDACRKVLPEGAFPPSPFIPAVGMWADDPPASRRFFAKQGIPTTESDGSFRIAASHALGAGVVVHGPGEGWPPAA